MTRTKKMLVASVVALSLSASGTGVALAATDSSARATQEVPAECETYSFFEWLFHHECHGHWWPF
jgi:hypothetical protein